MFYLPIRGICWILLRSLLWLFGGLRIEGREYVPRTGGVLIAANHISDADPLVIGAATPRYCYFMAKEELLQMRVIGPLMRFMRAFPVKRYSADRAALRRAVELLSRGEALVVFPEGRISETAELQEIYPGALMMAHHADVPILPSILVGTERMVPYAKWVPRHAHGKMVVRFGPPMTVEALTGGAKGGDGYRIGAQRLREVLLALQGERALTPHNVCK
jgi:1-acyl-sn-glycerol-3-phosphate acyltransferase